MSIISDKIAYLRGLADGLKIDDSTNEGKLIKSILDVLSDIAFELEDDKDALEELEDQIEAMDTDLKDLEDFTYYDYDSHDDCDCNCDYDYDDDHDCHCNDHCSCGNDSDCDNDSSIGYITVECPNCKKETSFDIEMFDKDTNHIECPNCHEKIEVVYEDTDDCNCDCHCE